MIRNAVIGFFHNIKESLTLNSYKFDKDNKLFRTYNILSFLLTAGGIVSFFIILFLSIKNQGFFPETNEFAIDKYYNIYMVSFIIIVVLLILFVLRIDRRRYDPINRKELWAIFLTILSVVAITLFGFICYNNRVLHWENDFIYLISFGNVLHPEKALVTYVCISLFSAIVAYWIFDNEAFLEPFELLSLIINTTFIIPFILLMVTNLKSNYLYIIILVLFILLLSLLVDEEEMEKRKELISENESIIEDNKIIVNNKVITRKKRRKSEIVKSNLDDDIEMFYFARGAKLSVSKKEKTGVDYIYRDGIYEVCPLENFKNGKAEIYIDRRRIFKITK